MTDNIYLTGFMGAGKTSVARELAALLGRRLVSTDDELAGRFGRNIAQVFAEEGEAAFRRQETALLRRLARRRRLVVDTGGGAPIDPANRVLMRAGGAIVHLDAPLALCRERLDAAGQSARPLWADLGAVEDLYRRRAAAYADCDLALAVDGRPPEALARAAAQAVAAGEPFVCRLGEASCPVTPTFEGPEAMAPLAAGRRVAVLTDRRVAGLHLPRYLAALPGAAPIVVPPGERSKTLAGAGRVLSTLAEARLERGDLLVALGGGMITDLGAFCAATYKRGMDLALVSTSLLGCVDAAVGGKAAVNLGRAKNLVGLFTTPRSVTLDLAALATLGRGQRAEGLVEAYKTGLAASPELAALVEAEMPRLLAGDLPLVARAAWLAARTKAEVVGEDFRESGRRRILNLGHTYGHAVEGWRKYQVSHGKSVAVGLVVAARISADRGLIDEELCGRIVAVLRPLLPKGPWPPAGAAWELMTHDKKNAGGKVVFVLLAGVGRPVVVDDLSPAELAAALARLGRG